MVKLEIEAYGAFACRVAWVTDTRVGLEFIEDPGATTLRLAALLAGT